MASGTEDHRGVLQNIIADKCVPEDVEERFFKALAARGRPSTPDEACRFAKDVIKADRVNLTCAGREVPPGVFVVLWRLDAGMLLKYRIPEEERDAFFGERGLEKDNPFRDQPKSVKEEIVAALNTRNLSLSNALGLFWVADKRDIDPVWPDIAQIADRLGWDLCHEESTVLIFWYERNDLPHSLRVPRVLDAINRPWFKPNPDCSAPAGKTRPLTLPEDQGLPEAVHRGCVMRAKVEIQDLP